MNLLRFRFAFGFGGILAAVLVLPCAVQAGSSATSPENELIPLERNTRVFAARGRTQAEVERQLGPPHHRIFANVWVYWDCESDLPRDKGGGGSYDTMIMTFVNGRVSSICLAPRASVEALIARVNAAKDAERNRVAAGR